MILRNLAVKHFRRFADFSLSLTPGLNVIYGPNEAGKSTLHDALLTGLFTKHSSRSAELVGSQPWSGSRLPEISLEFESDGQSFGVTKDFESRSLAVTNRQTGEVSTDWSSADAVIREAIGLDSAPAFRATASVSQGAIAAVASDKDRRGLGDELQKVVTGGGEEVMASSVMKKLDDRIARLQRGIQGQAREPGEIQTARNKLVELARGITASEDELARAEKAKEAVKSDGEKLAEMQEKRRGRRDLLAQCQRRLQVMQEVDEIRRKEEGLEGRIATAKDLRSQIGRAEEEMATYGAVADLTPATIGRLASLQEAISIWQQRAHDAEQGMENDEDGRVRARDVKLPSWFLWVGLILAVVAVAGAFFNLYVLVAALIGGIALAFYVGFRRAQQTDQVAADRSNYKRVRHAQRHMARADEEKQGILQRFSRPTYEDLLRDHEAYSVLAARCGELKARLAGLLSGDTEEGLEKTRREVSRARRDGEEMLAEPALANATLDPLSVQLLTREVEALDVAVEDTQREIMRNSAIVESSAVSLVDVHRLEEEQSFWQSQLAAAERRSEVYKTARAAVEEAKNRVLTSAKDILEAEMGDYLATITGGRYQKVAVDEATLSFAVYSPEKEDAAAMDVHDGLSRGAKDQIYLAARLALIKLICGGKKPPLILDDPFVTFDEFRRDNTMRLCRELAQHHQIILFTCDESYRQWADNFVSLPTP